MTATNRSPTEKYGQTKQEMITARKEIEKEKAQWLTKHNELKQKRTAALDEQFKTVFERLGSYIVSMQSVELQEVLQTLRPLVEQGASAGLLSDYELGPFNLAMLIKQIADITHMLIHSPITPQTTQSTNV